MENIKFGEYLVSNNAIKMSQLIRALQVQTKEDETGNYLMLGDILVQMKALNEKEKVSFLDLFGKEKNRDNGFDDDELNALRK